MVPVRLRHAERDPASSGRETGDLDSCFRRNDGRLHSIVICPRPSHSVAEHTCTFLKILIPSAGDKIRSVTILASI